MHANGNRLSILAPRAPLFQGLYGRMFRKLPPWSPVPADRIDGHFLSIARSEMVEAPGRTPTEIAADTSLITSLEQTFGSEIPAGYTYFGQFIDHDITFDPTSSLQRKNDPNGLVNFRTPRLDLDCVYGRGPAADPHMYDGRDPDKFLVDRIPDTRLRDLPRNSQGRAIIADPRNDENAIVSQLQLGFLLAHNELLERARSAGVPDPFEHARSRLRWLYQWIVWHDFVKRITDPHIWGVALQRADHSWVLGLSHVYSWREQPFMPVEFSVAAYRFGHSMVRNSYQTNQLHRGFGNFAAIFDVGASSADDLRGFGRLRKENYLQWDWFLEMQSSRGPFPQLARKIDTKLANALAALPEASNPGSPNNVLAFRNLKRGWTFELPAGSELAAHLGHPALDIPHDRDSLWFYILAEAEFGGGSHLGLTGSSIVASVFAGLLKGDPSSWINQRPDWTPGSEPLFRDSDNVDPGDWTLASLIRVAGLPVTADDVGTQS